MKAIILTMCLLLVGCDEQALNNPYPNDPSDANTLYLAFSIRPKHLDPAKSYSEDEWTFISQIYEPPLQYNYLARPYELEPLIAEEMPVPQYDAATDTSTYTIKIKPGIYYQKHPAFTKNGVGNHLYHDLSDQEASAMRNLADFAKHDSRELVAADYVNQIKRLADPKINSPIFGIMSTYIVGFSEFRKELQKVYDRYPKLLQVDLRHFEIAGVKTLDRYTYQIKLKGKYPQFKYWLALPFFAAVPWEADKFYSQAKLLDHNISLDWYPVGTGAFYLTENNPDRRMVMEKNPNFHDEFFPGIPEIKLPLLDKIVFSLEVESIPYWDKFLQGYYDISGVSSDNFNYAIGDSGGGLNLSQPLLDLGIRLNVENSLTVTYWAFNMLDDVVGGYSTRAKKLRAAINYAFDIDEYLTIFVNDRGTPAAGPIPVGILGGKAATHEDYNIKKAKKLLSEAGYHGGIDPKTGQQLQIYYEGVVSGDPNLQARLTWTRKQLRKIDIDLVIRSTDYNRFREKITNGNAQMFLWGWHADYPDPENFLFMFYGPNGQMKYGGENTSNYDNPRFNELYDQFRQVDDDAIRLTLINQMLQILDEDRPWIWGYFPQFYTLYNPWYGFSRPSKVINNHLKYVSVDPQLRTKLQAERNVATIWPIFILFAGLFVIIFPAILAYYKRANAPARRES